MSAQGQWTEARRHCLRIALRYANDPYEAEDIAQEALIRAWRNEGQLLATDSYWPWLSRIVRNEALRQHGRSRPQPSEQPGTELAEDDAGLLGVEERFDLELAMRGLPASERLLIALRYREDLTNGAIARALGIPEGTVRVRLHRARRKLRRTFEQS
jgi:RNA polymerase sigma-70 factor, ECF subfamily